MNNQFFYTRTQQFESKLENGETVMEEKSVKDSFNINKVIRSVTMDNGSVLVLLDDIHERTSEQPIINHETNKVTGTKKVTQVFQSEINLQGEDVERFEKLTAI